MAPKTTKKRTEKTDDDAGKPVYLRCTPEERANWERQAEMDGFRNFSDWLRVGLNKLSREARESRRSGKNG